MKPNSKAVPAGGGAAGIHSFKGIVRGRQKNESFIYWELILMLVIIGVGGHLCGLIYDVPGSPLYPL